MMYFMQVAKLIMQHFQSCCIFTIYEVKPTLQIGLNRRQPDRGKTVPEHLSIYQSYLIITFAKESMRVSCCYTVAASNSQIIVKPILCNKYSCQIYAWCYEIVLVLHEFGELTLNSLIPLE